MGTTGDHWTTLLPRHWLTWFNNPAFHYYVRHAYHLGGYDIIPNVGLDLDELGLNWVRTFNLRDRTSGLEYRMIEPEDNLHMLTNYDVRLCEWIAQTYGTPGACI